MDFLSGTEVLTSKIKYNIEYNRVISTYFNNLTDLTTKIDNLTTKI